MRDYLGLFFAARTRALQGVLAHPYHLLGRHALCGEGVACDGGAAALVSGRLRNASSLRRELAVTLPGDGGLLLAAYRRWGEDCVRRVEGTACCAVLDYEGDRLLLSRDRLGEGSVFYARKGRSLAFSSHIAPLLEAPEVTRTVDREGLCEIFGLGPARTPGRTPFRDVLALEPGTMLVADADGARVKRYFALEARPHEHDERATVAAVRALLEQAVAEAAPLRPAAMLSGGVDSSVLTALLGEGATTFSVDYEGNDAHFAEGNAYQPERDAPWVERAARAFNCRHTRVLLSQRALCDALEPAMLARSLPGMADVDASLLLFAREIARVGRCALSGECGDEVFGGYPWFNREDLIRAEGFPWSGSLALREGVLRKEVREKLRLGEYVAERYQEACERHEPLSGEAPREAKLRLLQDLCFRFFMPNLQERASRMCGASGVEVITPYCDERLAQYVYNVPWSMKALRGHEKGLLRAAMEDLVPEELLWRKKSPYPKTYHPEYARLVGERLARALDDPASPILQLVDRDRVRALSLSPVDTPWFGQLMTGAQMLGYLLQVNQWMLAYRVDLAL